MLAYITRRLVYGLVTLLALSVIVFSLLQASGGGPLDRLKLNPRMRSVIAQLTESWGLDQPIWRQYTTWLKNYLTPTEFSLQNAIPIVAIVAAGTLTFLIVKFLKSQWRGVYILGIWSVTLYVAITNLTVKLNWGVSSQGGGDVWGLVFSRMGATFRLGFTALAITLFIGIPLGIYQAVRQYSFFDQLGTIGAFLAYSTPIFIIGIGVQIVLGPYLEKWAGVKLFFVAGMNDPSYASFTTLEKIIDTLQHLALPAISIALFSLATHSRFQRASMLEVLYSDYLRTAKAKGLPRRTVIVTLVSLLLGFMIGGATIIESIFGWPGVGRMYISAIATIDYPVVMAIVMVIGVGIVIMIIVADVLYGVLDPSVRYD